MDREFFGIDPSGRQSVSTSKRRTGFVAEEVEYKDLNELLFKLQTDHIIGTSAQVTANDATCYYQSSDQTLRDADGTAVTLSDGDRVYIIGLDTLTADFDLSAYDRLRVTVDPSISLANSSQSLIFGDETNLDITVADETAVTMGTGSYGFVNGNLKSDQIISSDSNLETNQDIKFASGKGVSFSPYGSENLLSSYGVRKAWTPVAKFGTTQISGTVSDASYSYIGSLVNVTFQTTITGLNGGTGYFSIEGLPLAASRYAVGSVLSGNYFNLANVVPYVSAGNSKIQFARNPTGAAVAQGGLANTDIGTLSGASIAVTITYMS